ncbi:MAG: M3 family metallopeptidase [Bdellovibrionota bacterium]
MKKHTLLLIAVSLALTSCSSESKKPTSQKGFVLIRSDFSPTELSTLCDQTVDTFTERLNKLATNKNRPLSFENSFGELENAGTEFQEKLGPLSFMYSVSTNPELRAASEKCDSKSSQAIIEVSSRKDLYNVLKMAQSDLKKSKLREAQTRLITETMRGFRLSGLELPDDKLTEFKNLKKQMADLGIQFHGNLNNNTDSVEVSEEEMTGVPDTVKSRFEKLPTGKYKIPTKSTYYISYMENAANADARRKMLQAYDNREGKKNTEILQKMIKLRREAARLVGFKDWADYKTYDKMAKNGKTAWDFLQSLKGKLRQSYLKDYQAMLAFKKQTDPKATKLDAWDGAYFSNQLRKSKYSIDDEVLREYFPSDVVVPKMFDIYSKLFAVQFVPVDNANTWHPSVSLYEVRDQKSNELLAYFYTDLYPREGKYGHAAAFTLRSGKLVDGKFQQPISAIVANLNPPSADKPSLLSHDELETLFHEFGHIMHQTLTRVEYASLSGSSVAWDFVEAPSQVLENWVWEPSVLKSISSHYKTKEALPEEMIKKLISSRKFNQAWGSTRQLMLGIFDLTLHRSPTDLDVTETYKKLYRELTTMEPLPDTHFPATFGHLAGGYDAGYYGYLWSNVFAFDMYTKFQASNLGPEVGYKYRKTILEMGNTRDADKLLQAFLGRKPNSDAFFKFLGIK